MPTDLAYKYIRDDFVTLLSSTLSGATYNTLREITLTRELGKAPGSAFGGAYLIKWDGVDKFDYTISGYVYYNVKVKLQVGFDLNINETNGTTEMAAVTDIETIIQKRINQSSYPDNVHNITCNGTTGFKFVGDNFAYAEIDFTIKYQVSLG